MCDRYRRSRTVVWRADCREPRPAGCHAFFARSRTELPVGSSFEALGPHRMRFLRARFIVSHGLEVRRRFRLSDADSLPCLIFRSGRSFSDRSARARRRRPIQRAVRSCDEASVRLSPTASPCSRRLRLPICLRAQLTAFLTKLRGSSAAFPISPSSGRNLSSATACLRSPAPPSARRPCAGRIPPRAERIARSARRRTRCGGNRF